MPERSKASPGLVLHVGAHRTGTTALQLWLGQNRRALRSAGLEFWALDSFRRWLAAGLYGGPDTAARQGKRIAAARIRAEAALLAREGIARLIVSEENMIGSVGGNLTARGFYPDARVRLAQFRDAFATMPVRVILCIRSQADYWASALAYAVATGRAVPDAGLLQTLAEAPRGWSALAGELCATFPGSDILIADYEDWRGHGAEFAELLTGPLDPSLPGRIGRHHASLTLEKLRARLIARNDRDGAERLGPGSGKWQPFSMDQQDRLARHYRQDLAALDAGIGHARLVRPAGGSDG
jgi:hypothetical protein